MIILAGTTELLEIVTSAVCTVDAYVSWADITTTAFTPDATETAITTATSLYAETDQVRKCKE
jgi:hypothetical protein